MKKILVLIISLLMVLCVAGCAEYTPPVNENGGGNNNPVTPIDPNPGPEPTNPDDFVVTLVLIRMEEDENGETVTQRLPVTIPSGMNVRAQWTKNDGSGDSVHTATFNGRGVARISGLDGDYQVTILNLPSAYSYDPNVHTASNFTRSIEVNVYELNSPSQVHTRCLMSGEGGRSFYATISEFNKRGTFRATFTSADDIQYFQYKPTRNGVYTFTSLLDITANNINPLVDIYIGHSQYRRYVETIDDGGVTSTFTKNFQWQYSIDDLEVGGVMIFGLKIDCLQNASFPISIDFMLERDGEFTREGLRFGEEIIPTEDFTKEDTEDHTGLTWRPVGEVDGSLLDASKYVFNEETGYYETSEGKKLYVIITRVAPVLQGIETLTGESTPLTGAYLYEVNNKNYNAFINEYYALNVNSDGVYPVTKEMKEFLQEFAISQRYFVDGTGVCEYAGGYSSDEESMWLYACGYYC